MKNMEANISNLCHQCLRIFAARLQTTSLRLLEIASRISTISSPSSWKGYETDELQMAKH
jgi:hypothetical protein